MPDDNAAEPLATIARLRRELAEARAERDEALAQQTATAEVLGVINSSPGDLAPVFDAILEKARKLCGFAHGTLNTYDGEYFRTVAFHAIPEAFADVLRQPRRTGPNFERLLRGEGFVQVADLRDRKFSSDDPVHRAAVEIGGVRTLLMVPLRKDGVLLGYFTANRQEVRPFTDKQIALLQNFAAQAVIAMENARLITETREALEQQTATAEVLGVINSSPGDIAPVFEAILEKAHAICGAPQGAMYICEGEYSRAVAVRGLEPIAERLRAGRPIAGGIVGGPLLAGERFVQITDIAELDHFSVAGGSRTVLGVPLRKGDALLGFISAARPEVRPFSDREIAVLENFAAQAVIAMENVRLITETREALEQQTATAEVLGVINSSPGDLAPVFDAILEKAHNLCGVASGALQLYDGEIFRAVATNGLPEPLAELLRDGLSPGVSQQRVVAGEADVIHIADLATSDSPRARHIVEIGGVRTLLYVALRKDNKLLGGISASRFEVRPFSEKEIALLQSFAAQAVIAMENARLLGELRQRNDEIAGWNKALEDRVAAQLGELERVGKLKRFLAPQLAELIVARGDEAILETHRRDIVVVFCDLRDFTAFAETAEPEEVLDLLREYHGALGPVVSASEGTLDHFSGDGIMVFFNDPVPVADASERAVRMAIEMRAAMAGLQEAWRRQGRRIGFGAGIARGYATLGQIGFADRIDYTAIGTVCNLAARLCAEAKDGQILVSQRVAAAVEAAMPLEEMGEVALKGLSQPVAVYNLPA